LHANESFWLLGAAHRNWQYLPEINTSLAVLMQSTPTRLSSFTLPRINYQSWANSIEYVAFSTRQCAQLHKKFSKYVIPRSAIPFVCAAHATFIRMCIPATPIQQRPTISTILCYIRVASTYAPLSLQASFNSPHRIPHPKHAILLPYLNRLAITND
jgi:hypothetical protein